MDRMSKQAEARILAALEEIAAAVNGGADPGAAIVKVARAANLPAGHVPLLVQAYNIGRTTRTRLEGDDPVEKAADFDLADAGAILEALFPAAVKTAAAHEHATAVAAEYHLPPTWHRDAERAREHAKVAAAIDWRLDEPGAGRAAPPRHDGDDYRKAAGACQRRGVLVREARIKRAAAERRLLAGFEAVADAFRTPGGLKVADVRANVERLHGRPGLAVLDHVVRIRPGLGKAAATDTRHAVRGGDRPYAEVRAAVDAALHYAKAAAEVAEVTAAVAAEDEAEMRPFSEARGSESRSVLAGFDSGKRADFAGSVADKALGVGIFHSMTSLMGRNTAEPDKDKLVQRHLDKITTPEHEQALRGIETQSLLHEMMADDEVLSRYDPREVAQQFNRISQFAPAVAAQPLTAIPLVRKAVAQGQLDPFDSQEIADTEHKLKQIRSPHPVPQGGGHERPPGMA